VTLAEAAAEWLSAAHAGIARTRSGDPYKPSAIRSYAQVLNELRATLGARRLSAITRNDLQDLVDARVARGLAPSTVRNTILPLRAIYRDAVQRDHVVVNPTLKLALPANRARRDRVARPEEAAALIAAVPAEDRALWATAFYSGLRRGELQALQWADIDLELELIRVTRSWDRIEGFIEPKSRAGARRVPLISTLSRILLAHRRRVSGDGFLFGTTLKPFNPEEVVARARCSWRSAALEPIGFHDCRHTYAAFMIAAGVNAKALSTYMGHSSITTTLDRYGHLLPGNESEAAQRLETWLERAATQLPGACSRS
jgi:integrase